MLLSKFFNNGLIKRKGMSKVRYVIVCMLCIIHPNFTSKSSVPAEIFQGGRGAHNSIFAGESHRICIQSAHVVFQLHACRQMYLVSVLTNHQTSSPWFIGVAPGGAGGTLAPHLLSRQKINILDTTK